VGGWLFNTFNLGDFKMIILPENINMVELVKAVYDLSKPQGLGFLNFVDGGLTDEQAERFIDKERGIDMDYVGGRACKFHMYKRDGQWCLPDSWYDHTDEQYDRLLRKFGINRETTPEHGCACNCSECRVKQGKPANEFGELLGAMLSAMVERDHQNYDDGMIRTRDENGNMMVTIRERDDFCDEESMLTHEEGEEWAKENGLKKDDEDDKNI
jgi:hypothetical protein